jgi:MerR family mercuric resistance operon transcriptional regulator
MMKPDIEEKYDGVTTYKIGEVASRADVNKETVRYYEKRGLIPKPDRRRSGYRIFTHRHIDQIRFIKRAQELGFTLSEIKELLELRLDGDSSCEQVREKAELKLGEVKQKIKDLKNIKEVLGELIEACKADGTTEECVILNALEGERDGNY